MGSSGGDEGRISGSDMANCSEATVEIKIKTLDSHTYTLRVDKCVPVSALKEQIATVTGMLSEQQTLICRGRVLKDDQLLSAYYVEDGHTLHLVARQPVLPSSGSSPDRPASSLRQQGNSAGARVVIGAFNLSEQGGGIPSGLSRFISAILDFNGITNIGSGNEGADAIRDASAESFSRIHAGGLRNSGRQGNSTRRGQSIPSSNVSPSLTSVPSEPLQLPVISDSLSTLSQYLTRIRREFRANVGGENSNSQAAGTQGNDGEESAAGGQAGLPTPSFLADVVLSTRQILTEQAADCLSELSRQLENQANVIDPLARTNIQSNAIRSGILLQNLGAVLLELGRTTMTLRMGQSPADTIVNAGPPVFVSMSGPNPIMVQVTDYTRDLEEMQNVSREEYLASLRRKSSGFSRGISKYRGLPRWDPSLRMPGPDYLNSIKYGTGEDAATESDYAAGFCIDRKIDLTAYIKWWGPSKSRQSDSLTKSSEETKHGHCDDIGSELKILEWVVRPTEPYQMPKLGVFHEAKNKGSALSAMSVLSRSAAYKGLQEKASKKQEKHTDNDENENKCNINKKAYGKAIDKSSHDGRSEGVGVALGTSGGLPLQRNIYPIPPFLSSPLLTNYNTMDPLSDPILWTTLVPVLPAGLSRTNEVTKTESSSNYTYFQQEE